jgi:hypothetical protein
MPTEKQLIGLLSHAKHIIERYVKLNDEADHQECSMKHLNKWERLANEKDEWLEKFGKIDLR